MFYYFIELKCLAVVPTIESKPLSDKFKGRLCTIFFFIWHIQIIDKNDICSANKRSVDSFSSLLFLQLAF